VLLGTLLVGAVLVGSQLVPWGPGAGASRADRGGGSRAESVAGSIGDPSARLTVVTANLWVSNPQPLGDLARLVALRPDVLGLQEARRFDPLLLGIDGYLAVVPDQVPAESQDPILLRRATTRFLGSGAERMCGAVGSAPARWAVYALFESGGRRIAYVNTHLDSHVEQDGRPYPLPRVRRYVEHLDRLALLVDSLRSRGYDVLVGGDFNWAWTGSRQQWVHAPVRMFDALGLVVQWSQPTAPAGASFEDRRIDYLAHDPGSLRIAGQRLVGGHSDHLWPLVTYRVVAPGRRAAPASRAGSRVVGRAGPFGAWRRTD
jgi:endonuclease/exonuclease/phosphatase (EEP) superfamily protein YafD